MESTRVVPLKETQECATKHSHMTIIVSKKSHGLRTTLTFFAAASLAKILLR